MDVEGLLSKAVEIVVAKPRGGGDRPDGGWGADGVLLGATHEPDAPGSRPGEIIPGVSDGRSPKAAGPTASRRPRIAASWSAHLARNGFAAPSLRR